MYQTTLDLGGLFKAGYSWPICTPKPEESNNKKFIFGFETGGAQKRKIGGNLKIGELSTSDMNPMCRRRSQPSIRPDIPSSFPAGIEPWPHM